MSTVHTDEIIDQIETAEIASGAGTYSISVEPVHIGREPWNGVTIRGDALEFPVSFTPSEARTLAMSLLLAAEKAQRLEESK